MIVSRDIAYLRKYGDKCAVGVSRKGEYQPCDAPAVAVAVDAEEGYDQWWPVCPHHSRGRRMVKLPELIAAVTQEYC